MTDHAESPMRRQPPQREGFAVLAGIRDAVAAARWQVVLPGAAALLLGLGSLHLLQLLARPLALLFLGVVIAAALSPLVAWLDRKLPRAAAVAAPYVALVLVVVFALFLVVPPFLAQAQDALNRLPMLVTDLSTWLADRGLVSEDQLFNLLASQVNRLVGFVASLPALVLGLLLEIITVFFLSLYWLLVQPRIWSFTLSLIPEGRQDAVADELREMGTVMGGYVRGVAIDAVIVGTLAYVGFMVLGIQFPLVLAIVAGILEVVPYVGPILAGIPPVIVALFDSPGQAALVLVFWIALQQFENNILVPYVMRSQTNIPPVLVVFALLAGLTIGGVLGAFVAIPLSGALRILIIRTLAPAVRRWTGADVSRQENEHPRAA
ncbi:MAG: AI-2E family transporter [Chloroflexi bacterium]|nr:AI-2E family transporter [Chloroflexota bacterium]